MESVPLNHDLPPNADHRAAARWLYVIALGILLYSGVALVVAWSIAAVTDRLPTQSEIDYYERTANGPWDHAIDLNILTSSALLAPVVAGIPAVLSLLIHPSKRSATLLASCLVAFLTIVLTHFWLID
jgi:hypothetical protein